MLNTILFDLDGTLLPLVQDEFIHAYLSALVHRLTPMGYDGKKLVDGLWRGVEAMTANDGRMTNRQVFWESFTRDLGVAALALEPMLEDFYLTDFNHVQTILREKADRSGLIASLRQRGYTTVLATNPMFPACAVHTRMAWIGLRPEDFAHITTYENCRHSKPNPEYFRDILSFVDKTPEECLMVGNNPTEDMSALDAGLSGFLVTDYLENPDNVPCDGFRHGSFSELAACLEALPDIH